MKVQKHSSSAYWCIAIGVAQAIVVSVLIAALGAVFIDNESLDINAIPIISFAAWLISSFMCAIYSGHKGEGRWAVRSAISTLIYYVLIMSIAVFVFDGISSIAISGLIAGALGLLLAILLLRRRIKRPMNRKFKRITSR